VRCVGPAVTPMGSAASLFPTTVLDCKTTSAAADPGARYDYACATSSSGELLRPGGGKEVHADDCASPIVAASLRRTRGGAVRTGITLLHLILMVAVCFATLFVYIVYLRVVDRRQAMRLQALPALRSMPLKASEVSHAVHAAILTAFLKQSSLEAVPLPPVTRGSTTPGPIGWASASDAGMTGGGAAGGVRDDDVRLRDAIREMGSVLVSGLNAIFPPAQVPTRTGLRTLRSLAPLLVQRFGLSPSTVWPVVCAVERADLVGDDVSPRDFSSFQSRANDILAAMRAAGGHTTDGGGGTGLDRAWGTGTLSDRLHTGSPGVGAASGSRGGTSPGPTPDATDRVPSTGSVMLREGAAGAARAAVSLTGGINGGGGGVPSQSAPSPVRLVESTTGDSDRAGLDLALRVIAANRVGARVPGV